ncbi:uncharacterized protein I303_101995 [Kwoniella dejecticola CBS 10117]|uniref:Uncharacterized protein n=1 Tax=Kwoniella dejecticola CBS 10117 TaxID=1296121 RepID=A0A1A6AC83_9TREE|nr:uncharacterized protein I303_01868 [Kwoniella dejecticola CBS 10117]OBR87660.1 hypothetical protein I303_01868 [Kwoniella dejecticola CBS 10117]
MPKRRLLNQEELVIARRLQSAVANDNDSRDFACGGIISGEASSNAGIRLYYNKIEDDQAQGPPKWVQLPFDAASAKELYLAGQPSPFGRGKETVYDEEYRQAREIKIPYLALSSDPLLKSGSPVLLTKKLNYEAPLMFSLNKLNAYAEGGFFKEHRDTSQGIHHIGTLILCLPSPFKGGDLVVQHGGHKATFDWSNQVRNGDIAWGFLYSDCKHEVLPLEQGIRITLQYDVFVSDNKNAPQFDDVYDNRLETVTRAFDEMKHGPFLAEGGVLAFGLQYKYPIDAESQENSVAGLEYRLKGIDAVFMKCLKASQLQWDYFGVFDDDELRCYIGDSDSADEDGINEAGSVGPSLSSQQPQKDHTYIKDLWVSGSVYEMEGAQMGEYTPDLDLKIKRELVWITEPQHFNIRNDYETYGNEWEKETVYAAIAVEVHLPAAGVEPRQSRSPNKRQRND